MARYLVQRKGHVAHNTWFDTDLTFNSKAEIDAWIESQDYEWRVGFCWKPYDQPMHRTIWHSGKKKGQEVKV